MLCPEGISIIESERAMDGRWEGMEDGCMDEETKDEEEEGKRERKPASTKLKGAAFLLPSVDSFLSIPSPEPQRERERESELALQSVCSLKTRPSIDPSE